MASLRKGSTVSWKWGKSKADGKVEKTSASKTEIKSKGSKVTKNGTKDNKAVTIKQKDGTKVIKKESELQ